MRKKRFIFFLLSVLCCVGSTYAQKNIGSYDKDDAGNKIYSLKTAMKELSNLSTYKTAYDNADATLKTILGNEPTKIEDPNPTVEDLTSIINQLNNGVDGKSSFYFCEVKKTSRNVFLAITTKEELTTPISNQWKSESTPQCYNRQLSNWGNEIVWSKIKMTDEDITNYSLSDISKSGCKKMLVYYGTGSYDENNQPIVAYAEANISLTDVVDILMDKNIMNPIMEDILPITITDPELVKESATYKAWEKDRDAAQDALTTAQNDYTNAQAFQKITITGDITVPTGSSSLGVWPSGCTLTGNYNHIINNSENPLFSENNGTIQNLFSLDIDIADEGTGKMRNCIIKSHYDNKYYIYGGVGTAGQGFALLEEAIYSDRETYGMDFSAGKDEITEDNKEAAIKKSVGLKKTDENGNSNKLYVVQYANASRTNVSSYKANIKKAGVEAGIYSRVGKLSCNNTVAYIDDVDDYVTGAVTALTNVATKSGDGYVCAKAVLTDGESSEEFYAPKAFTATNLSYGRKVTTKYASVCLPFELNAGKLSTMHATAYTYSHVDEKSGKMKFSPISSVGANTPCILAFEDDYVSEENTPFSGYSRVNVPVTPAYLNSGDSFFGNYKAQQTAADLAAAVEEDGKFVYGVQKDKFVKMVGNTKMNAFRSFVLLSEDISQTSTGDARTFTISLLDEEGNEEVTGIELVSTTNSTNSDFKAVGGRNAIEITTGKACDVKVYTLNGALAKTARVEAGTTTLPMNAGMYVVNKTKVIVK